MTPREPHERPCIACVYLTDGGPPCSRRDCDSLKVCIHCGRCDSDSCDTFTISAAQHAKATADAKAMAEHDSLTGTGDTSITFMTQSMSLKSRKGLFDRKVDEIAIALSTLKLNKQVHNTVTPIKTTAETRRDNGGSIADVLTVGLELSEQIGLAVILTCRADTICVPESGPTVREGRIFLRAIDPTAPDHFVQVGPEGKWIEDTYPADWPKAES